ncbi:MAG: hypothetical protein MRY78_13535 [Saprospiraceae bacterium]|nr:hypothetical protein [Saprospiraceae bacterium]
MNWQALEHRMRNELHDHQSFDLEEASLWSAIEAQMEPPKRKRKGLLLFCFLGLGILFLLMGLWWFQPATKPLVDRRSGMSQLPLADFAQAGTTDTVCPEVQSFTAESQQRTPFFKPTTNKKPSEFPTSALPKRPFPKLSFTRKLKTSFSQHILPVQQLKPLNHSLASLPISLSGKSNKKKFWLQLEAGMSQMQSTSTYEMPSPGLQLSLNAWSAKESGWLWGGGFSYLEQWVKFQYQNDYEAIEVQDGVLQHLLIDAASQDTLGMRFGPEAVPVQHSRSVQHYNQFSSLGISVYGGFLWQQSRLSYGLLGGLQFQHDFLQSGRTLNANKNVIDFNTGTYYAQNSVLLQLKPMLLYHVSDHWAVSLSPQISWRWKGSAVSKSRGDLSLSLGLVRSFTFR